MKFWIRLVQTAIASGFLFAGVVAADVEPGAAREVLILFGSWTDESQVRLVSALNEKDELDQNVRLTILSIPPIYTEFSVTPEEQAYSYSLLNRELQKKAPDIVFDEVISVGNTPARFLDVYPEFQQQAERSSFFITWDPKTSKRYLSDYEPQKSLSLIKRVHPDVDDVVFLNFGYHWVGEVAEELKQSWEETFKTDFSFSTLNYSSAEALEANLNAKPANTVVISIATNLREANTIANLKRPVHTVLDLQTSSFLGGMLVSIDKLARVIFHKAQNQPLSPTENQVLQPTFTYAKLQQFNVDEALLPPDSIVSGEPTFSVRYKTFIIILGGVAGLITLALVAFVIDRANSVRLLRNANARINIASQDGGIGLFEHNHQTGLVTGNSVFQDIFQLPDPGNHGTPIERLVAGMSADIKQLREKTLSQGDSGYEITYLHTCQDGTQKWLKVKVRYRYNSNGDASSFGSAIDVTDHVNRERQLSTVIDRQRKMFSIISHELRTPAATIQMLADELDCSPEDQQELQTVTSHLLNVIDDLRVTIAPKAAITIENKPLDIPTLFNDVERQTSQLATKRGFNIILSFSGNTDLCLVSDPYRLRSILTNLVRNSVHHSKGSGIWLKGNVEAISDGKAKVTLSVDDNGIGIPPEEIDRLFDPFERGQSDAEGTGVGLYIVKSWAELMGGSVRYATNELGGASFVLDFIWQTSSGDSDSLLRQEALKKQTINWAAEVLANKTILVAEDDRILRRTIAKVLNKNFGVDPILAENGHSALEAYVNSPPDLIITDYFMPKMDGLDLIKQIRESDKTTPIIALTAATLGDEKELLLQAGADYVLSKPLDINSLSKSTVELHRDNRISNTAKLAKVAKLQTP